MSDGFRPPGSQQIDVPRAGAGIAGNPGPYTPPPGTLAGLSDVDTTGGADTNVLALDAAEGLWEPAPAGGSSGISQSYAGYNVVGASVEALVAGRVTAKRIVLASAGLLAAVAANMRNTVDDYCDFTAYVYGDNGAGTAPQLLLATPQTASHVALEYQHGAGTRRWFEAPMGVWLAAGTYWIGVEGGGPGAPDIAYDAGGTDRQMATAVPQAQVDWGLFADAATTHQYSIRATILR